MSETKYLSEFRTPEDAIAWLKRQHIRGYEGHIQQCWDAMKSGGPDQEGRMVDYELRPVQFISLVKLKIVKVRR